MKTLVILFCLAGLAASAIILDRPRLNVNIVEGSQNAGIGRLYTMTRDELLRQKFILDILKQVELPLQNRDFLQVGLDGITDENLYIGPLDKDMLLVLDLIRSNRILGKSDTCSLSNEQNLRQLIGLYRLFVRSRDFASFQRLVIYARKSVNPVLFVNALTLALADRDDTRILIVPALYEILPRSYNDDSLIRAVENAGVNAVQRNIGSIRPSILDIIELGRNTRLLKSLPLENGYPGGIIDRSQLWKPWRDMRRQLALQNSLHGSVFVYDQGKQDVSVSLISGGGSDNGKQLGLISEDVGLRAFLNILLDELIVEQGNIQNAGNIDQSLPTNQIRGSGIRDVDINVDIDTELEKNANQEQNIDILGQLNQPSLLNDRNVQRNDVEDIDTKGQRSLINLIKSGGTLAQNSLNYWRKAINIRGQDYLNRKANIPLDRDNIESKQSGILDGSLPDTNAKEISKDLNERLSTADPDQNNIFADIKRGSTDESDWLNAQLPNGVVNNRQRLDDALPTTSINSDRLLHVSGRRLRLLEGKEQNHFTDDTLVQRERSQAHISDIEEGNNLLDDNRSPLQSGFINNRKSLDGDLPTTSINSDRLLHIGGRRLRFLQGKEQNHFTDDTLEQRKRSQTPVIGIEEGNNLLDSDRSTKRLDEDLTTTSINSDHLLHIGGKRLRLLQGKQQHLFADDIAQSERSQTPVAGIEQGNNLLNADRPLLQRGFINNRQHLDDDLPTTSIDSDRLLHVSGRRLRLLEGKQQNLYTDDIIGQRERSQTPVAGIEEDNNLPSLQRGFISNRQGLNDDLPTTSINSDRLLHVSGRRVRLLQGKEQTRYTDDILGQHQRSQTPLSGIEESNNLLDSVQPTLQRVPRSLQRISSDDRRRAHFVQLILYQLQQLVARLNIEQIALQNGQDNLRLSVTNDIRIDDRFKGIIGDKLNEITERLDQSLQQAIAHLSNRQSYYNQINADDDQTILQELEQIALSAILHEVVNLSEYVQGGQISNVLENHTTQLLLRHVINTVEQQIQKLKKQRNLEEISFNSVNINNLKVDGLRTFLEDVDIDLSNLQGAQQENKKIIIGRVPRLNHKSFTINLDLTSDRNQRVIVRTLLGPKINVTSLQQQERQNFILLDIASIDLKVGRNAIKRKSRDITWTGRDVTSYSEIYERVLRALRGDVDLTSDAIFGQTTLFPDRLLLPRGRADGLPMQILVVITPAENQQSFRQPVGGTRLGLDSLILDNLPIRYPLDRDITNVGKLLTLPNVFSKDVIIYHDEKIKRLPQ